MSPRPQRRPRVADRVPRPGGAPADVRTAETHARTRNAIVACAALVLALTTRPAAAQLTPASDAARIAALIPDGVVTAEVLTPDYSQRMQEISRRLMNAAQADPIWFQAWVAQHPGGPLPWNARLGVTQEEYDVYMREGREAKYAVRTRVRLTFARQGRARRWTLKGWGLLTPIDGLTIDVDNGQVITTRWGNLPFIGVSKPNEPGVQLPWNWYAVWKASHQVGDPRHGGQAMAASLHMGPLGDGRMVGLYWVTRRLNRGKQLADEFLLLRFPARH